MQAVQALNNKAGPGRMCRPHEHPGILMARDDFVLELIKQDLADQEELIDEQEKHLALLRTAGLPTADARARLEKLSTIHVKFLELEVALEPQAANRLRRRLH